jgi:hypothetical protein
MRNYSPKFRYWKLNECETTISPYSNKVLFIINVTETYEFHKHNLQIKIAERFQVNENCRM